MRRWCVTVMLVLGLSGSVAAMAAAPQKRVYRAGTLAFGGGNFDMVVKGIGDIMVKVLEEEHGLRWSMKMFAAPDAFYGAIAASELDLFIGDHHHFWLLPNRKDYTIIGTYEVFGRTDNRTCLFVRKDSPVKTVADLKGRAVMTYHDDPASYLDLWAMVGGPPDGFFGVLTVSPNGRSSAYALTLDQVDAAMIGSLSWNGLEFTEPGVRKKLRRLACGPWRKNIPVMLHKRVPPGVGDVLVEHFEGAIDHEAYQQFRPLARKLGLKFLRATTKDYETVAAFYAKAQEDGRLEAYRQWYRYASKEKRD